MSDVFKIAKKNSLYPDDYEPGKEYGRDVLARIFAKLTDWPYLVVREAFFPLLPGGKEPMHDPGAMKVYSNDPITIEKFAEKEKEKYKSWSSENVELSWDNLSNECKKFIKKKKAAPGYEERVNAQKKRVEDSDMDPKAIITNDEPIILTKEDGKYYIMEGFHRSLALLEMLKAGKFGKVDSISVRAYVGEKK